VRRAIAVLVLAAASLHGQEDTSSTQVDTSPRGLRKIFRSLLDVIHKPTPAERARATEQVLTEKLPETISIEGHEKEVGAAASYLAVLAHRWNPQYSTAEIQHTIAIDIEQHGVSNGLLVPTLAMYDLYTLAGHPEVSHTFVGPIISHLNPSIARHLSLPKELPTGIAGFGHSDTASRYDSAVLAALDGQVDFSRIRSRRSPSLRGSRMSGLPSLNEISGNWSSDDSRLPSRADGRVPTLRSLLVDAMAARLGLSSADANLKGSEGRDPARARFSSSIDDTGSRRAPLSGMNGDELMARVKCDAQCVSHNIPSAGTAISVGGVVGGFFGGLVNKPEQGKQLGEFAGGVIAGIATIRECVSKCPEPTPTPQASPNQPAPTPAVTPPNPAPTPAPSSPIPSNVPQPATPTPKQTTPQTSPPSTSPKPETPTKEPNTGDQPVKDPKEKDPKKGKENPEFTSPSGGHEEVAYPGRDPFVYVVEDGPADAFPSALSRQEIRAIQINYGPEGRVLNNDQPYVSLPKGDPPP